MALAVGLGEFDLGPEDQDGGMSLSAADYVVDCVTEHVAKDAGCEIFHDHPVIDGGSRCCPCEGLVMGEMILWYDLAQFIDGSLLYNSLRCNLGSGEGLGELEGDRESETPVDLIKNEACEWHGVQFGGFVVASGKSFIQVSKSVGLVNGCQWVVAAVGQMGSDPWPQDVTSKEWLDDGGWTKLGPVGNGGSYLGGYGLQEAPALSDEAAVGSGGFD